VVIYRDEYIPPCVHAGPLPFFGMKGRKDLAMSARFICAGCSIKVTCLEGALERHEPYGIFGGLTPAQRRVENIRRAWEIHKALHPVQEIA